MLVNTQEIIQVRGLGKNCQAIAYIDSSFKVYVTQYLDFYERHHFRSHTFTTTKKARGLGMALLGHLDLCMVELFKWVPLDTITGQTIPNLTTKNIQVKDKKLEIMILSTQDKVNIYRIDEPTNERKTMKIGKLGFV